MALLDPFSPYACGAKIPSMFADYTSTSRILGQFTVSTNASGVASFILTPNPQFTVFQDVGTNSSAATASISPFLGLTSVSYAASVQSLTAMYASYRAVSAGWALRNAMPELSSTGRMYISAFPVCGLMPGVDLMNNATLGPLITTDHLLQEVWGVGTPGATWSHIPATLMSALGSIETTMNDIMHVPLVCRNAPCGPQYGNWVNGSNTDDLGGGVSFGAQTYERAGTIYDGDNITNMDWRGHHSFFVVITGAPASTPVLDVEFVIHLEGRPNAPGTQPYGGSAVSADATRAIADPAPIIAESSAASLYGVSDVLSRFVGDAVRAAGGPAAVASRAYQAYRSWRSPPRLLLN